MRGRNRRAPGPLGAGRQRHRDRLLPGSPAARALRPGDVLVEIDESAAASASAASATEARAAARARRLRRRARRNRPIERLVRAQFELVRRKSRRAPSRTAWACWRSARSRARPSGSRAVTQLRRDGAKGRALDLRGNGGGDLDAAVKAAIYS